MLPPLFSECSLTRSQLGLPVTEGTLAYALDGDDDRAVLVTHAEFGCVMSERR